MAITNYGELDTALDNWLQRTDLTSRIAEFIRLAEAKFDRYIRHPQMHIRATATLNAQYLALPADWLEAVSLHIDTTPITQLQSLPPERLVEYRMGRSAAGRPKFYSIVGTTLEAYPTPDQSYTIEMLYWARLEKLNSANTSSTNWLLLQYPDIYLYGALCEAEAFTYNDERLPLWKSLLEQALTELRAEADRAQVGETPQARFKAIG